MPKLLSTRHVNMYRNGEHNDQGNLPQKKPASGRACCRACGHRIEKGVQAIVVPHDFHGYGSHTSVQAWLHTSDDECIFTN